MSPRRALAVWSVAITLACPAVTAQTFEAAEIDLSVAARSGEGVDIGAGRIEATGAWRLGDFGLQVIVQSSGLGLTGALDDTIRQDALRLIGFYDATPTLRLGLSATQIRGDYPTDETAIGLHARYAAPGLRIEGELTIPPTDSADNGLLTGVLSLEQDLGRDVTLRGLLHRRSTDEERDDLYAIVLGGEYRFANGLFAYGEAYNTANDDKLFDNIGLTAGLGYHIDDRGEIYGALTLKEGEGESGRGINGAGLTIGARWTIGGAAAADGLFGIDPLLDPAGYGAY